MSVNYTDAILDAIQISVDSTVNKLRFDKTYQGTIIKVNDLNTGEYTVSLQGGEFFAYSLDLNKEYHINDQVFIKVPQGDLTEKKIIEGKVKNIKMSAAERDALRSNIEQFGPSWNVWYEIPNGRFGVSAQPDEDTCSVFNNGESNEILKLYATQASYIRIKAKFSTEFYSAHSKGNYGLKIEFLTNESSEIVYFDVDDFNGNPYNFIDPASQEIIIPIRKSVITGLGSIILFQEGFEQDRQGDAPIAEKNIFVEDIQIAFVSVSDVATYDYYLTYEAPDGIVFYGDKETLTLTPVLLANGERVDKEKCICSLYQRDYSITADNENYRKDAGLGWKFVAYIDKNSEPFSFSFDKCLWQEEYLIIMNYEGNLSRREFILTNANSNYTVNVEQIVNEENKSVICVNVNPNSGLSYKWYIKYPSGEVAAQTSATASNFVVGNYLLYDSVIFYCEILSETGRIGSIQWKLKSPTSQDDFTVVFSGTKSFLYDANGEAPDSYINQDQMITADIVWTEGCNTSDATVEWEVPGSNTMIESYHSNGTTLYFKPLRRFNRNKTNNTVFVIITLLNGASYRIPCPIEFLKTGDPGTNGTSFTCSIVPNDSNIWELNGSNSEVGFRAEVRKNGELITAGVSYKWSGVNVNLTNTSSSSVGVSGLASTNADYYYVKLEVSITGFTTLYSFYPLDILSGPDRDRNKINIDLPNYIKYNTNGFYPIYSNIQIITYNDQEPSSPIDLNVPYCYNKEAEIITYSFQSGIVYKHTIVHYIDTYGNETINGWDGHSLELGDGGTILAPQIGAGTKDGNNRFTGVVMGKDSEQSVVGLYGYNAGVNTFGLTAEGKAYFGSVDSGRLSIDGTSAVIYGGLTKNEANSMTLTLQKNSMNTATNAIYIRGTSADDVFSVNYKGEMKATKATVTGNITAETLTANNGTIGNWDISSSGISKGNMSISSNSGIQFGSSSGQRFYVNSSGEITANYGHIGGWSIDSTKLYSGDTILNSSTGITTNALTIKEDNIRLGILGLVEGSATHNNSLYPTKNIGIKGSAYTYSSTTVDGTTISGITPSIVFESNASIRLDAFDSIYLNTDRGAVYVNGTRIG